MKKDINIYYLVMLMCILIPLQGMAQELERGEQAIREGYPLEALRIWESALSQGKENPEVGFRYIELVASLGIDSLYSFAETAYFTSLSTEAIVNRKESISKELHRLKPIVDQADYNKWSSQLSSDDTTFVSEIRAFWKLQNTFLSSHYNERLIEHWQRIAKARKEFNRNSKSGFDTDDRGILYVKLGEPTNIKKGTVSLSELNDPTTGVSISLSNNIYFEYELWYYGNLSYVFGIPGSGGPFGLQNGILDLIPLAGNRPTSYYDLNEGINQLSDLKLRQNNSSGDGAPPRQSIQVGSSSSVRKINRQAAELILQYAVLSEIAGVDQFYLELHNEMTQDLIRQNVNGSSNVFNSIASSQNIKYKAKERNWAAINKIQAPRSVTGTKPIQKTNEVNVHVFNLLDNEMEPENLIITEQLNFNSLQLYLSKNNTENIRPIYQVEHFSSYDEDWIKLSDDVFSSYVFDSSFTNYKSYVISTLSNEILFQSSFIDSAGSLFEVALEGEPYLISSGNIEYITPDNSIIEDFNSKGYAVSDVILANVQPENLNTRIPFFPSLNNRFTINDDIIVYFETYGIPKGATFSLRNESKENESATEVVLTSDGSQNKVWFAFHLNETIVERGRNERELVINFRGKSIRKKVSFIVE